MHFIFFYFSNKGLASARFAIAETWFKPQNVIDKTLTFFEQLILINIEYK